MNKTAKYMWIGLLGLVIANPVFAAEGKHDMSAHEHGARQEQVKKTGQEIRMVMVDGYHLSYNLIDMRERMAASGHEHSMPMAEMKSHHLMLYLNGSDGKTVEGAKVGFLVTGPTGDEQKAMAMAMPGGYGADLELGEKGVYTIKTKVVAVAGKISDQFEYEVK